MVKLQESSSFWLLKVVGWRRWLEGVVGGDWLERVVGGDWLEGVVGGGGWR